RLQQAEPLYWEAMIPAPLEYLFLLLVYALLLVLFLAHRLLRVLRQRALWISCALLTATWAAIEINALHQRWWVFPLDKICGVFLATVPLEEYLAFILIHISAVALWTALGDARELA